MGRYRIDGGEWSDGESVGRMARVEKGAHIHTTCTSALLLLAILTDQDTPVTSR